VWLEEVVRGEEVRTGDEDRQGSVGHIALRMVALILSEIGAEQRSDRTYVLQGHSGCCCDKKPWGARAEPRPRASHCIVWVSGDGRGLVTVEDK
jgi:hypothetical protein